MHHLSLGISSQNFSSVGSMFAASEGRGRHPPRCGTGDGEHPVRAAVPGKVSTEHCCPKHRGMDQYGISNSEMSCPQRIIISFWGCVRFVLKMPHKFHVRHSLAMKATTFPRVELDSTCIKSQFALCFHPTELYFRKKAGKVAEEDLCGTGGPAIFPSRRNPAVLRPVHSCCHTVAL